MRNERIVAIRSGGPEVLKLISEELPGPTGRQLRIRVLASGVAYGDMYLRAGFVPFTSYPITPGYDFVGVVDSEPPDGALHRRGDIVAGLPTVGGYTRYICIDDDRLVAVPAGLDPAQAVSAILNYTTADHLLSNVAKLKKGDSALVHAAAGGVGTALVQLARRDEIEVFGTADTKKLDLVTALGATPIDYKHTDFVTAMKAFKPHGVSAVFDAIGGSHLFRSNRVVAARGILVAYGITRAIQENRHPLISLLRTLAIFSALKLTPNRRRFTFGAIPASVKRTSDQARRGMAKMLSLLDRREIAPVIGATFPLDQAAEAHTLLATSQLTGKIVLLAER